MFHTLAGVLLLLLASPIYDGLRLYSSAKAQPEAAVSVDLRCGGAEGPQQREQAQCLGGLWGPGATAAAGALPQQAASAVIAVLQ